MLPIHIIGHAGCGKTTLIVELVSLLVKRKFHVGTLKHSAHSHELDKPGKDTYLHRTAGAAPVTMVTGQMCAVYLPKDETTTPELILSRFYSDVDIVLIEGWISGPYQKFEVWRDRVGKKPLYTELENVKALITDDVVQNALLPVFPRKDLNILIDSILPLL